jgi:hypothetical protein
MRALILVAGAALALSACSGGQSEANEVDTLAVNNLIVDENTAMDANMTMNMDMNAADPATQNMMMNDMTTNNADTNLANGM